MEQACLGVCPNHHHHSHHHHHNTQLSSLQSIRSRRSNRKVNATTRCGSSSSRFAKGIQCMRAVVIASGGGDRHKNGNNSIHKDIAAASSSHKPEEEDEEVGPEAANADQGFFSHEDAAADTHLFHTWNSLKPPRHDLLHNKSVANGDLEESIISYEGLDSISSSSTTTTSSSSPTAPGFHPPVPAEPISKNSKESPCKEGQDGGSSSSREVLQNNNADNSQWKNVFPAYLQSKENESGRESEEIVKTVDGNGEPKGTVNGIAAKKAAAAATASAKALQSHVNNRNSQSIPVDTPSSSSSSSSSSSAAAAAPWPPTEHGGNLSDLISNDPIWAAVRAEARLEAEREPLLSSFLYASILAHSCFERSLGFVLANRLTSATLLPTQLMDIFDEIFMNDSSIRQAIRLDVQAVKDRDPSCRFYSSALLYLKGYHALQSYRAAHWLWHNHSRVLALALQARISEVFAVDIHPAAQIGKAILLDHGTGVVIGETAVVGDRVSMLQGVTLGGTGKAAGDRHPKIQEGVLIGAGATILGNIVVGRGAMVAAGSLVLKDVPAHSMVAGTPAKVVGFLQESTPSLTMKHDAAQGFCDELEEAVRSQLGIDIWTGAGI